MQLVTGVNRAYFTRALSYLATLEKYANFPVNLITVGFETDIDSSRISNFYLSQEDNYGSPPQTESIQHGSFLKVLETSKQEVILYTDADMVMQRGLDKEEIKYLKLKNNEVLASWNGGPHETLELEAGRLNMRCDIYQFINDWGVLVKHSPIYNVGFLAMNRYTWEKLHEAYIRDWNSIELYFGHMARQQWLISYKIAQLQFDVKIAPWSLHAHGHFGLKPGMTRKSGLIYWEDKLAAFRHYL